LSVGSDEFVQTCSSGTLTSTGAAIGAGLLALSLVAAALPAGGRESAFDSG
jgi:amino acid permease